MAQKTNMNNDFTGFEYRDISVSRQMEELYIDSLPCFGWQIEGIYENSANSPRKILHIKRSRNLRNHAELSRLQGRFESKASEISRLEGSKLFHPSFTAYLLGLIGTGFMTLAFFQFRAGNPVFTVLPLIPGGAGWISPYFIFRTLLERKSAELDPYIEEKYDEITETCRQASKLSGKTESGR